VLEHHRIAHAVSLQQSADECVYGVWIIGVITNMVNLFGNVPYWYSNLVTALLLLVVILL
jgi:ribose/xylose/arabinose/galactoside ABC-type transport system permease subunit